MTRPLLFTIILICAIAAYLVFGKGLKTPVGLIAHLKPEVAPQATAAKSYSVKSAARVYEVPSVPARQVEFRPVPKGDYKLFPTSKGIVGVETSGKQKLVAFWNTVSLEECRQGEEAKLFPGKCLVFPDGQAVEVNAELEAQLPTYLKRASQMAFDASRLGQPGVMVRE